MESVGYSVSSINSRGFCCFSLYSNSSQYIVDAQYTLIAYFYYCGFYWQALRNVKMIITTTNMY